MTIKRVSHRRARPGSRSAGRFFHIEVRPAREFVRFRVQDVGKPGGVQRLAGQRAGGSWDTQKWLIEKTHAHIENGRLVPDSIAARKVLVGLGSRPVHVTGDRFKAKPRRVPEADNLTLRRAQLKNIKRLKSRSDDTRHAFEKSGDDRMRMSFIFNIRYHARDGSYGSNPW